MEQATLSGAVFRTYEELQADPASSPSPPTPPTVVAHDLLQTISERGQGALEESEILLTQLYDEGTSHAVAEAAVHAAGPHGRIAALYCPALFRSIREMHPDRTSDHLFEFDPRYQALGNTTLLPMEAPSTVPHKQQHCFDVVIADLSYMHDARDVKDALETSRLLTRLHEPLKIIVLALENFHGLLKGEGLQEAAIKPHCRGRADLVVFAKMVAL